MRISLQTSFFFALGFLFTCQGQLFADETQYVAHDTLKIKADKSADAAECLAGLTWKPSSFQVRVLPEDQKNGVRLVRFPSPIPSGKSVNDLVCMEWSPARLDGERLAEAPAIVVVHESGRQMEVGRIFASSLSHLGFQAFLIHLPGYGERREEGASRLTDNPLLMLRQAVADVRRARDAVSVLNGVNSEVIALQGTSLGGFVSTTAASLDGKYDAVFLMLAGGDLYSILQNGQKDAAKARERLAKMGYADEKLKDLTEVVEPLRVCHRLNPEKTWLYSGRFDKVVPFDNAASLARNIGLTEPHHIKMPTNHYSGIVFLPQVLTHMQQQMHLLSK